MLTRALNGALSVARLLAMLCCLTLAGCQRAGSTGDVLAQDSAGDVVFAKKNCEVVNADGNRCDKKTCKADAESNCEYFASRCVASGHNYSGTSEGGTCSRATPEN